MIAIWFALMPFVALLDGDTFIIWDTLFGTRYLPSGIGAPQDARFEGVEEYPTTWWKQLLSPIGSNP